MTVVKDIETQLSHHELLTVEKEALCALTHGAHLFIAFSISLNLISLYIFPHWVRHESIPTIEITTAVLCQVHDACRTLTSSPSGLIIAS